MTLQQILDFMAVLQHGSVHQAARAAGQTQPALTKSIRRLEQNLGVTLFDRGARGVQPTEFGRRFATHARRILSEARMAQDAMAQLMGGRLGRVQYGTSLAVSVLLAPRAIANFRELYPEVDLHCRGGLYHHLAPLLRDGQIDFAMCPLPLHGDAVGPRFVAHRLIESSLLLVARRDSRYAKATDLASLRQARFVAIGPTGQPGAGVYAMFRRAGLPDPEVELHADGALEAAAFVAGGDCLALVPASLMRTGLLRERLAVVPIADELPTYSIALIQRADTPLTPAAEALANLFRREAEIVESLN